MRPPGGAAVLPAVLSAVLSAAALALAYAAAPAAAQTLGTDVPRGSAERKALLDTVRPGAELQLGLAVEFVVDRLAVHGDWAFLSGEIQRPGGAPIECRDIRFADDCGFLDGFTVFSLLRREGKRWRLMDLHIGPTDLSWSAWPLQYGVPCRMLLPDDYCERESLP